MEIIQFNQSTYRVLDYIEHEDENYVISIPYNSEEEMNLNLQNMFKENEKKFLILKYEENSKNKSKTYKSVLNHYDLKSVFIMFNYKWRFFLNEKFLKLEFEGLGIVTFQILDLIEYDEDEYIVLEFVKDQKIKEHEVFYCKKDEYSEDDKIAIFRISKNHKKNLDVYENQVFENIEDLNIDRIIYYLFRKKWEHVIEFV